MERKQKSLIGDFLFEDNKYYIERKSEKKFIEIFNLLNIKFELTYANRTSNYRPENRPDIFTAKDMIKINKCMKTMSKRYIVKSEDMKKVMDYLEFTGYEIFSKGDYIKIKDINNIGRRITLLKLINTDLENKLTIIYDKLDPMNLKEFEKEVIEYEDMLNDNNQIIKKYEENINNIYKY